jgi:hypothetical protein
MSAADGHVLDVESFTPVAGRARWFIPIDPLKVDGRSPTR